MAITTRFSPHKAGDTFSYAGTCSLPAGAWTATCEIRSAQGDSTLIGTVAVTLGAIGPATPIALSATAAETLLWQPGQHQLDIRYADAGTVVHTSTLILPVIRAVTE